ncbi:hypothetical protein Glove_113g60 [Diversispora epigaea]|uniref:Uncharacterized protein n=1 Tax=Diversispora epigaea TaxID=1348612 RepID=A0A397J5Z1_9GLOM|nr:hypothetical protein Glove_113g60 [Diversispora epigaea]
MSLNSDNFNQIEELQSIQEENLSPVSENSYQYEKKSDTNINNTLKEFEPKSLTLQDNIEESEVEIKEFPNEAYADLITLITKHNFNNKAGNSIIKFFKKHSNLSQLPFLKNIETGQKFINKMNILQLLYSKYCILIYNNQEYFINYRSIKNCIEILLSNLKIL